MLLSRVAEALYWMVRYLVRAEDTARMVMVNSELLLDLPRPISPGWQPLLAITGSTEDFYKHFKEPTERNIVKFLVSDERNPGSILASLTMVRENMRTTRAIVPREAWETLRDLRVFAAESSSSGLSRRGRYGYLRQIIGGCQQIMGNLCSAMSRDRAYTFTYVGWNVERADIGVRIIDVRAQSLLPKQVEELKPFSDIQWKSVLRSLASYQNYRQHVHVRVKGAAVLAFLLQGERSPRCLGYCLAHIEHCLRELPRNDSPLRTLGRVQRLVKEADVHGLMAENLHQYLESLQDAMADLHDHIAATYFQVEPLEREPMAAVG